MWRSFSVDNMVSLNCSEVFQRPGDLRAPSEAVRDMVAMLSYYTTIGYQSASL